jgi:hypothetical protein
MLSPKIEGMRTSAETLPAAALRHAIQSTVAVVFISFSSKKRYSTSLKSESYQGKVIFRDGVFLLKVMAQRMDGFRNEGRGGGVGFG